MTRRQQIAQLKADRESLEPLLEKAREEDDQEEIQRLRSLAIKINRALDDLLFDEFANAAVKLKEIATDLAAAKRRAESDSNFFPDVNFPNFEEEEDLEDETAGEPVGAEHDTSSENPAIEDDDLKLPPPDSGSGGELLLSEAHLLALWKRSQFPVFAGGLITFGVRGALPVVSSGTEFGSSHEIFISPINYSTMNCTIGQWLPGSGFAVFPGSTVPYGPSVQKRIPANGVGINQLGRGRYKRYISGWHKRSEGRNGHWALLQDSAITLQRTGDDPDFDLVDRWESGKIAGDNIHCAFHMGPNANIPSSKYSSFGCQVIAGTVKKGVEGSEAGPWKKFVVPFQKDGGQQQTEYVLFSASEVQQMIKTRCSGKTILLRFGSQGEYVRLLQTRLSEKLGRPIKVDGDFGPGTFEAVLEFQEAEFGPEYDDGIVGGETAQKLGIMLPFFDFDDAISGGNGLVVPSSGTEGRESGPSQSNGGGQPASTGVRLTEPVFKKIATQPSSHARSRNTYDGYMTALCSDEATEMLSEYKINKTSNRLAHFLAQVAHETESFTFKRESLNYTTVGAIRDAWKSRASKHSDEWIRKNLLRNPVALGTWAYGGRMGNGEANDDGYRYRGGGIMQTTGRDAYRRMGEIAGVDLENNPELIEQPLISLKAACAEWKSLKANEFADSNDIKKISRGINRGDPNSSKKANGEADRINRFRLISEILK